MKVVSQLKRTLSTVLAMMMIFTSVPQMAMPVFASEVEELVAVDAASAAVVEDEIITTSADAISVEEAKDLGVTEVISQNLIVTLPSKTNKLFVKTNKKGTNNKVSSKAFTTQMMVGGKLKKVDAIYSISPNTPSGIVIDRQSGKITIPANYFSASKTSVTVEVTVKKADDTAVQAGPFAITFATKGVADAATKAYVATLSGNSYVIYDSKANPISANATGYYAIVTTVSGNLAAGTVVTKNQVVNFDNLTGTNSKKINTKLVEDHTALEIVPTAKATSTITFKPVDGSKKKIPALKVYSKYADLTPSNLVLNVVTSREYDEKGNIISETTETVSANSTAVSINGIAGQDLLAYFTTKDGSDVKSYSFKPTIKKGKFIKNTAYNVEFVVNEKLTKNGKTKLYGPDEAVITVKGAKGTQPATFKVTMTDTAKEKINKISQKKGNVINNDKASASQNLIFTVTDTTVSGNIAVEENALAAAKLKGASRSAYYTLLFAINNTDRVVKNGEVNVEIAAGALEGIKAGTYTYTVVANGKAPTPVKVKVTNKAVQKAVVDLKSTKISISKNSTSQNAVSQNLVFKPAKGKTKGISANELKLVKVNNAYFKGVKNADGTKGYTNKFTQYFDVTRVGEGFVVTYIGTGKVSDLNKNDLVGYITYSTPSAYNADGSVRARVTKTVKITVKLTAK